MTPFPETADIETSSADYAGRFASRAGQWMLALQEAIVCRWLPGDSPQTVLDVGGGHAQLAPPLARLGHAVTVVGSDPVCAARLEPDLGQGRLAFRVGNVIALPFDDRSFDTVVCIRLLPHCERWPELVAELCRVARKRVIVDYPAFWSVNVVADRLFALKRRVEANTRPFRLFRHAEVREGFRKGGFRPARRKPQFFLPMVLHRMLNQPAFSSGLEKAFAAFGLTSIWGSPVLAEYARAAEPTPAKPVSGPVADDD